MANQLTRAEIESLHQSCQAILKQVMFRTTEARDTRRLEADTLLINLAWKILVPIVVSITGSLTSEVAKKLILKSKGQENAETQVKAMVGKTKSTLSDEEIDLCVQSITEIINEYAGTREQAETIVKVLVRKLNETKK